MKTNSFIFLSQIAFRNIFRNLRRTTLCILAIFMAVYLIIVFYGYGFGFFNVMTTDIQNFEAGHLIVETKEYKDKKFFFPVQYPIDIQGKTINDELKDINSINGVKKAFPRIISHATLSDNNMKNAILWGINISEELKYNIFNQKTKNKNNCLVSGRYPDPDKNECAIGYSMASKMALGIGDRIILKIISSEYSDKFYSPKIVGIFDFDYADIDKNYIIIPFEKMQHLTTLEDRSQLIYVYVNDPVKADQFVNPIKDKLNNDPDVIVEPWTKNFWMVYFKQAQIIMNIVFIIFIIVASFLIINTIIMIIHERIKEVGMMGALGMKRSEIVFTFFMEAAFMSFFGSLIGAILGGLTTLFFSHYPIDTRALTGETFAMSNTIFFQFSFKLIFTGFIYGFVTSSICSIFPSLKVAFVKPVEALRR